MFVQVDEHQQVQWNGAQRRLVRQYDHYFVAHVPVEQQRLGDVAAMHAHDRIVRYRWWSLAELDATTEAIYPVVLAGLVQGLRL